MRNYMYIYYFVNKIVNNDNYIIKILLVAQMLNSFPFINNSINNDYYFYRLL